MAEGTPGQIGRYKVLELLGRGGFGRVYRAFDPTVGRPVAIKVLTEAGKDVLTRFRNEATVAGNLRHKNIVTVYEYGEHQGQPFLAMEYLEGEDLHHIIASKKPLTLLEKCNIMWEVAEGLEYAHSRGVVHRDVKPANIMVLGDGSVKIMDFGIARLMRDHDATRLTKQGSVIGTLFYMAPEQFGGAEIDALCDIFAYGVVYYELITGKHPFEAADARALMFKMSFEEPRPIRNFIPDFPDALQRVINRILHKERDLRHQSLKEVQLYIEPIRHELQKQRAEALLVQAQELYEQKQFDQAKTVVLEILGLAPSNQVARALWETMQKQFQQRTLQPRIEALLTAGEEHLAGRRFAESMQNFESALRLDRENLQIQERLEQLRALWEQSKKSELLLVEARKELDRHNLTAAYRSVSEALRHDPQNVEASALLKLIQTLVERRQREQLVEETIHKAEGLLLVQAYDEAIRLLTDLGPDAESEKIRQMLTSIRAEKNEEDKKQRLRDEMATATDLLRHRRMAEAVNCLENLHQEFPENKEVSHLLAFGRKELGAEERAKLVQQMAAQANGLVSAHDFEAALGVLDDALKKFPGETVLIGVLSTAMAAKADWERQQTVQATLRQCADLRARRRFSEAIELVEATLRDYSDDRALAELLQQLENEWAEQRRAEAVRRAEEQARKLLEEKQPEKAADFLQQTLVQYPGQTGLTDLLSRAQQQVRELVRARAVDAIVAQVALHAREQEFDRALQILDEGLAAWQNDSVLVKQRDELQAAKRVWDRQQAIQKITARARKLGASEQFTEALGEIAAARREYPDEAALVQLESQIALAWDQCKYRDAVRGVASEARLLISRGRLDEAVGMLKDATSKYPGEAKLEALVVQAQQAVRARERLSEVQRLFEQSRALAAAREFDRACRLIDQGLQTYAGDANLTGQLDAMRAAKTSWQRQQAIDQARQKAVELAQGLRFQDALELLTRSLEEYKDEPALVEARRQIEADWQQHNRRQAVAKAGSEARTLLDQGRLEEAIERLRDSSSRYPGEAEWKSLLERAEQELAARRRVEERARAIRQAVADADQLARQRRFEEALALAAKSLQQYAGEAALVELKQRLEKEWELDKRAQTIARSAADAQTLIGQGRLDDAVRFLGKACAQYPGEAALDGLLAQAKAAVETRRRRDQAVRDAEVPLREGRLEDAHGFLQQALAQFPGDRELTLLLTRAREQLEARQRARDIEKLAADADALANARDFDRALALLEQGLKSWPGEKRLAEIQASTRARKTAWQREQALGEAVQAVQKLAHDKRFAEALQKLDAALKQFGEEPALVQLRKQCRMRKGLVDAGGLLERARPADAIRTLEESAADYLAEPEVSALMERARAQARAQAIDKQAKEARARLDRGDVDGALALVEEGLRQWPDARVFLEIRKAALAARAARERQEAIRNAIRQCEDLATQGRLGAALELAQKFLEEFQNETGLLNLRQRLEAQLREQEGRRNREHDLQELRALEGEARQASTLSRITEMLELARQIAAKYPGDEEVRAAAADPMKYLSDIENAARELSNRNFAVVLEICGRYPVNSLITRMKNEAEALKKRAYVEDLQRRARAEAKLESRVQMLEAGLKRYPDEKWIQDELRIARNKLDLVNSILQKARAAEAAGQWEEALEQWNQLGTIDEQRPGLKSEIERVQQTRERQRTETVTRWVQLIEDQLKAEDLAKAGEFLRQARTEFTDVAALQDQSKRLEELRKKRKRAREVLSKAQAAAASDWRRAEALLNESLSLHAGQAVPDDLVRAIANGKRDTAVTEALAEAERIGRSDLRAAVAVVEKVLAVYPDEPRLKQWRDTIAAEIQRRREAWIAELRSLQQAAQAAKDLAQLESLQNRASAIATENAQDAELRALAEQTVLNLKARIQQLKREQLWAGIAAKRKWIAASVAGLAAIAAGAVGIRGWMHSRQEIPVTIAANIAGASVAVGGKSCVTPDCALTLRPGTYTLTVTRDGYRSLTQTLTVPSQQSQINLPLALQPLPEVLQVNTNFESGRIFIDSRPAGELRDGQFSMPGPGPGSHTIRVTGSGAEFQAQWRSAPGASPQLLVPIEAKDVQAAVVANVGGTGSIACNCDVTNVTVDGVTAEHTGAPAGSFQLQHLKEGTRRIAIASRSLLVNVQPNPALNVFLSLDRNVGTLVIESSENNARIYVNNRVYPRNTEQGLLRIPVEVGEYSVRVEKDGFRAQAQAVDIKKGEEKQVSFTLTPIPPILEIAGALPGSQVKVDGSAAGETDAKGGFRTELARGDHQIELTKEGYAPVRFQAQFTPGKITRPDRGQLAMTKVIKAPPPPPPPDPKEIEAQDWQRVANSSNPDELENFARTHPGGAHTEEARSRATQLRNQVQANAARQAEQAAWDGIDKTKKAPLQEYVSRYGNGPHVQEARRLLDAINKREADATAAAQRAREQKEREQEQASRLAADQAAIRRTVSALETAYNQKDVATVQKIWTGMTSVVAAQFRFTKTVAFELKPTDSPVVNENTATVNCNRSLKLTSTDGTRHANGPERVRVQLERAGAQWVILSITKN